MASVKRIIFKNSNFFKRYKIKSRKIPKISTIDAAIKFPTKIDFTA